MGSRIHPGNYTYEIRAVDGNNERFSKIEVIRNSNVIYQTFPKTEKILLKGEIKVSSGEYYYVKVFQSDNEMAVSSPIFVINKVKSYISSSNDDAEELYNGNEIENIPDIIIQKQEGIEFFAETPSNEIFLKPLQGIVERPGDHSQYGMYAVVNDSLKKNHEDNRDILDLYPTICNILGIEIPNKIEGNE